MTRRRVLQQLSHLALGMYAAHEAQAGQSALAPVAQCVRAGRPLSFPTDFGAHPDTRIEWWYVTGVLHSPRDTFGFQLTFFRSKTGLMPNASRFSPQQLLFAHAAISDLARQRLRHDQRIARQGFERAQAALGDTLVRLRDWQLRREGRAEQSTYLASVGSSAAGFDLALKLNTTQPVLLQGESGYSRKGPRETQASHYYSQPQLQVSGQLRLDGLQHEVSGRAWLDHEWSNSLLDSEAVGWDWIGMNLADGRALTAFRLRRFDGSPLWAGGSLRAGGVGDKTEVFGPEEVSFTPERVWSSPHSQGRYPVVWQIHTPAGRFEVRALLDDQELDSRQSTGAIYWEGLSECRNEAGQVIGHGYLEMTGYASRLKL